TQVEVNASLRVREANRERLRASGGRLHLRFESPRRLIDDGDLRSADLRGPARQRRAEHVDVARERLTVDGKLDVDLRRRLVEADLQGRHLVLLLTALVLEVHRVRALFERLAVDLDDA